MLIHWFLRASVSWGRPCLVTCGMYVYMCMCIKGGRRDRGEGAGAALERARRRGGRGRQASGRRPPSGGRGEQRRGDGEGNSKRGRGQHSTAERGGGCMQQEEDRPSVLNRCVCGRGETGRSTLFFLVLLRFRFVRRRPCLAGGERGLPLHSTAQAGRQAGTSGTSGRGAVAGRLYTCCGVDGLVRKKTGPP